MNQLAPSLSFEIHAEPLFCGIPSKVASFSKQLRNFAAQFQLHHALIHRLGPPNAMLKDTTYVSTLRDMNFSGWTLGDLINAPALSTLLTHNGAIFWQHDGCKMRLKTDPLNRLDIRYGISIPFHNAFGNHAALTLCDSHQPNINTAEFSQLALPLIDTILTTERLKNTARASLSNRETDCLQWVAAGKTSIETGIILGLSPHTVNQYLTSAATKLVAVNRTHAVTKAVRLGLINLTTV